MLTAAENAQLIHVGPGTLMGDLMRRYWIPVVQSSEIEAGGPVKRVRLLGEDLVVFRAPSGRPGLMSELCAHRRASLYFARNEERGLRCVYHGWQYDCTGRCVDMPNERPESSFQDKVTLAAYAAHDGVVLEITDTGIGIPEERLETLTQPFAFRHDVLTREQNGAGLGIAIARAIAETSGGRLAIDSRMGLGTTVAISLPLLPAVEQVQAAAA